MLRAETGSEPTVILEYLVSHANVSEKNELAVKLIAMLDKHGACRPARAQQTSVPLWPPHVYSPALHTQP